MTSLITVARVTVRTRPTPTMYPEEKDVITSKRHVSCTLRTRSGGQLPHSMLTFRVAGNAWVVSAVAAPTVICVLWRLVLFLNMLNERLLAVKVSGISPIPSCICTKMRLAFYIIMSWHKGHVPPRSVIHPDTKPSSHFFKQIAS